PAPGPRRARAAVRPLRGPHDPVRMALAPRVAGARAGVARVARTPRRHAVAGAALGLGREPARARAHALALARDPARAMGRTRPRAARGGAPAAGARAERGGLARRGHRARD